MECKEKQIAFKIDTRFLRNWIIVEFVPTLIYRVILLYFIFDLIKSKKKVGEIVIYKELELINFTNILKSDVT